MPLPVQPASIPTAPATVGGLPAVICASPELVVFSNTLTMGWGREGFAGQEYDFLAIWGGEFPPGSGEAGFDPHGLITESRISFAAPLGPIEGAPSADDIPGAWLAIAGLGNEWNPGDSGGLLLPVPLPPDYEIPGVSDQASIWVRIQGRTDAGQIVSYFVFMPEGFPDAFGQAVPLWVVPPGQDPIEITIPSDDPPPAELGPITNVEIENLIGEGPPERKAVAVAQGCADVPFRVEGVEGGTPIASTAELEIPAEGLPIAAPVGGLPISAPEGGLPIAAPEGGLPIAQQLASSMAFTGESSGAGDVEDVPVTDGWVKLIASAVAPDAGATVVLAVGGVQAFLDSKPAPGGGFTFGPLIIDAPAGFVLGDCSLSLQGAAGPVAGGVAAFYPPEA